MIFDRSLHEDRRPLWLPLVLHDLVLVTGLHLKAYLEVALGLWGLCLDYEVVVAVGAVLVSLFEFLDGLAEDLLALLAGEDEFHGLLQFMVAFLAFPVLCVALRAVEPHLAAGGSDGYLGVQNMLAHCLTVYCLKINYNKSLSYNQNNLNM